MSESKAAKTTSDTKIRRTRTMSTSEIRCGIANCSYSAKQTKTVERHRQTKHEIEPHQSLLDFSVSASILDDTAVVSETDNLASSLEHKTSSEFYSDMSKVEQSTQLETRRRKRSTDSEGEEEEKRPKLNSELPEPSLTQSPGKKERDNLCAEAMAALKERTDKENLDTSKSLLEETSDVGATNSAILDGLNAGDMSSSQSLLMVTAQDTDININVNTTVTDSMSLNMGDTNHEIKNLEDQLALRTRSLEDALSKIAQLKTDKAAKVKLAEHWEGKVEGKDREIKRLSGIIKALKDGLAKPDAVVAAKDAKIMEQTNKIQALKKRVDDHKEETKRAKDSAEVSRSLVDGFLITQADHKAQIVRLKRQILCTEADCIGEKECGYSHAKKEENRGQCKYFNFGKCDKGNECTYKHDIEARKKHHEERKLKKDEKEKEEAPKGDKVEENKEEEKEEKKAKGKGEKSKAKRKKRKEAAKKSKTESNDGQSTTMEVEETPNPATLTGAKATDIIEPPIQVPQPPAQQTPSTSSINPQHVAPFQQPQIPTNFNFGQPQYPTAPPTLAPAGGAPWSAQWSGPSPADMALEHARHQEAVQAQAMSRRMRLDNLRNELSSVQARLMTVHNAPPGSVNINELVMHEMTLKRRMYEGNY